MYLMKIEEPIIGKDKLRNVKVLNESGLEVFSTRVQLDLVESMIMYIVRCNNLMMSNRGRRDIDGLVKPLDSYIFLNIGQSIYDHRCIFNVNGKTKVLSMYIPSTGMSYEIDIRVIQEPSSVYH